jgi:hypothetical protein
MADTQNTIPSFEAYASAWQEAQRDFDAASGKFSDAVRALLMQYLDACRTAGVPKDEAGIKGMQAEMLGCQTVVDWVAAGWAPANLAAWCRCATRAYYHGLPDVMSGYALDDKLKFPWSPKRTKASKPGKAKPANKAPTDMPPAPDMAPLTGPQSAADVRAFIEGYAKTLTAYLNKHMALADLPTRDVVQHFAQAVAKLPKVS